MRPGRAIIGFCIGFACLAGGTARAAMTEAQGWSLRQLMHALSLVKSASAHFTERKTLHMLKSPVTLSGTLTYVAPDHVTKVTVSPAPGRFVLDGGQVTISGSGDQAPRTFSLAQAPQLAGLVEGIRATLAGDLPTLDHFYVVQFAGDAARWQLQLRPRSAELAHFITRMTIAGSQDHIDTIDTAGHDGDHSEMSIVEGPGDVR